MTAALVTGRVAFAHDAVLAMSESADDRAPGGAITPSGSAGAEFGS